MSQDKQVALVTDGIRGIGYEMVKQLASNGFKLILASRDPEMGHEAVQKLKESNLDISCVTIGIANQENTH